MQIDASGWLSDIPHVPSPNCNERPESCPVSLLVIHNISLPPGEFGGGYVEAFFQNRLDTAAHPYFASIAGLEVSAHLLIERSGRTVQFVSFDRRAWHAGRSCFAGQIECNDYSIGIELEGTDTEPYTEAQYCQLVSVIGLLQARYPPLTRERITGHSDIAPARKTDPGPAFDWAKLRRMLKKAQAPSA